MLKTHIPKAALCGLALLGGCATGGNVGPLPTQGPACSARLIVTMRPGMAAQRGDLDLRSLARSFGARVSIDDSVGNSSRSVTVTARGGAQVCEQVVQSVEEHPRVMSVQRLD